MNTRTQPPSDSAATSNQAEVPAQTLPISILRLPDVIARVGLKRASIYQRMDIGDFPKPIPLGSRAVGWLEHEINAWLQKRMALR